MILCNLSVLLAERHLKISKVSQDTGISRTTLTALANNYGKGLQFDTIDTLCIYLKTTPAQLIAFAPVTIDNFMVKTNEIGANSFSADISMDIELSGKKYKCSMSGRIHVDSDDRGICHAGIELGLWDEVANPDPETKENNMVINKAFGMLTRIFIEDIARTIQHEIYDEIESTLPDCVDGEVYHAYFFADGFSVSFSWPFDDWGNG
jgi:DNA-binding Xre family transcriptional regulator